MDWYKRRKGDTHYPVPVTSRWAKELDKTSGVPELTKVLYLRALISGCDSRIKFAASTGLYNKAYALKSLVHCCEADESKMRNADWRVAVSERPRFSRSGYRRAADAIGLTLFRLQSCSLIALNY